MASGFPNRLFALTIGINTYLDPETPNLKGAAADADSFVQLLIEKGVPTNRIRSLRNEEAKRVAIRHELTALITNPDIERDDPILIYYAGHGNSDPAPPEWRNWDPWVQCLVPHDFNEPDGRGGVIHGIPDRALGTILNRIAKEKGNNITVILDCCHSGSGTRDVKTLVRSAPPSRRPLPADIDEDLFSSTRGAHILPKFRHHGIESHILLAACKLDEVAHEFQGQGQFTGALLAALRTLDTSSITYSELIRQLRVVPYQNPQCEGKIDRLLFSNDFRSMKGYYPAKLEMIKEKSVRAKVTKIEEKLQLQVQAGLVHEITADTFFDIWASLSDLSGRPLAICKALKVTSLRTVLDWKPRDDVQPPRTLIAKPQKSFKPTLRYYISEDIRTSFNSMLEASSAQKAPFCLSETTKELADIAILTISEGLTFEVVASEESSFHQPSPRELGPLIDMWDFFKSFASYYHKLRHDNSLAANVIVKEGEATIRKAFMSMFDVEVYQLDEETQEPISDNLNIPGKGVYLAIEDDEDAEFVFKITNRSTFGVYPYLFYFNSHNLSIESFYSPVNVSNQKIDHPLKAANNIWVGLDPSGYPPRSFGLDPETDVENGFLKLYITQEYVNLDHIEQEALSETDQRGTKAPKQAQTQELWGAIRIPFVLKRKQEGSEEHGVRGEDPEDVEEEIPPLICLLGSKNAKASLLQEIFATSTAKDTHFVEPFTVHQLVLDSGSEIAFLDIPAFEDRYVGANAALCADLFSFFGGYERTDCNALVFAYDISKPRVEEADVLNFGLIRDLCGDPFYKNVTIATTNWPQGGSSVNFEKREAELRSRSDYCHGLVNHGARLHRCMPGGSISTLLSTLAFNESIPLGIQIEARCNMPMTKTGIGASLRSRLYKAIDVERSRCKDMEEELEDAKVGLDDPLPDDEVEAIKQDLRTAKDEVMRLSQVLQGIESNFGLN